MSPRSGFCMVIVLWLGSARLEAADSLRWRAEESRVDAQIESWPLPRVLEVITAATGWQVYVEPDTEYAVTTRFRNLKPADALRRLLGDLNFALLPQTHGPAKLFIYRHSVNEATHLVRADGPPGPGRRTKAIANELVVILKPGAREKIDGVSARVEARVVGRLERFGAYRLQFKDGAAARDARSALERDDDVSTIESNFTIAPPADLEPLAMSSPAPLSLTPNTSPSADRVVVGLVDTAVQGQAGGLEGFLQPGVSLNGDYQPPADQITHGTAMAETILDGVARALEEHGGSGKVPLSIIPLDVYGAEETTTSFDVARGLYEALDRHANVVNLSLAGDHDSPLLETLIRDATNHGVLVFAAAGNSPVTTPTYPAADPGAIAVTAGDPPDDIAPYANRGAFVDAIAPGVNVVRYEDRAWLGTGTSFSTGWVTGWAAGFIAGSRPSSSLARSETLRRWGIAVRP